MGHIEKPCDVMSSSLPLSILVEVLLMLWTKQDMMSSCKQAVTLHYEGHLTSRVCAHTQKRRYMRVINSATISTDQSKMHTLRHHYPTFHTRLLFLTDCDCSKGKKGFYRSPPKGHGQRKTGYSW